MASVVVGDDCEIGEATVIHPNVTIYRGSRIGSRVLIHSGAVIGADGFGFFVEGDRLRKWPHVGNVVIEDDVEIGANACVDRGKYGSTLIETGAKIDNLVQIAHNCRVGPGAVVAALAGLAGSVVLEDRVVCGGQVGVTEHVTIGCGAQLAAQSGVIADIPAGSVEFGCPARPRYRAFAELAMLRYLTDNRRVVKKLVRQAAPK
jgi:UDP-3-O-[3-hydroxymyristoyl] glucosamine N-acyltransferase